MREIKFRAWDEQNKVMHNNFQFISNGESANDWVIFISDKFSLENHKTNPFKNPNPYFSKQLKKMQYTGLKDKNGVEIYEGDIVYLEDWNAHIPERFGIPLHETREVTFKGGIFCLQCLQNDTQCGINYAKMDLTEVIGNIYENKELLND